VECPQRKPQRLKGYDYSQNGAYFITICTANRSNILAEIVGFGIPDEPQENVGFGILDEPQVKMSDVGIKVCESLEFINKNSTSITIDKYVVMPNHVHIILFINNGSSGMPNPTNAIVPKTISSLKRFTNKSCGFSLWQSHYYDHVVRDEEDYLRICRYMDENPLKWQEDKYYLDNNVT